MLYTRTVSASRIVTSRAASYYATSAAVKSMFIRFDSTIEVTGISKARTGGPFDHPAAAFVATGSIAGRRVTCLSADAQMTNHAWGYAPADTDFHDMRLLATRLGTALLPPYMA